MSRLKYIPPEGVVVRIETKPRSFSNDSVIEITARPAKASRDNGFDYYASSDWVDMHEHWNDLQYHMDRYVRVRSEAEHPCFVLPSEMRLSYDLRYASPLRIWNLEDYLKTMRKVTRSIERLEKTTHHARSRTVGGQMVLFKEALKAQWVQASWGGRPRLTDDEAIVDMIHQQYEKLWTNEL